MLAIFEEVKLRRYRHLPDWLVGACVYFLSQRNATERKKND